jgi:hypothetical protein
MQTVFAMVREVTNKFIPLATSNYDSWRKAWVNKFSQLPYWNPLWMAVAGKPMDVTVPDDLRESCAKCIINTIDMTIHEQWLLDVPINDPQAIFRRLHLKFRGTENLALSSSIKAQLLTMTQLSTKMDVVTFGVAMQSNMVKLKELGTPMDEKEMVNLYLLGIAKPFDPIRWSLQKRIKNGKLIEPNVTTVLQMVEDWAMQLKDRNLITYKDTKGSAPTVPVLTLYGDVLTKHHVPMITSDEACRSWLKSGVCRAHDAKRCKYKHDNKKKGINKPSPHVSSVATASTKHDGPPDYTKFSCTLCNTAGHSANWGQCPTKLANRAAKTPKPTPVLTMSSTSVTDTLMKQNESILQILAMLANNQKRHNAPGNPLLHGDDD